MATKTDYTALDAAILGRIRFLLGSGATASFWAVMDGDNIGAMCVALADEYKVVRSSPGWEKTPRAFLADRLQALRRAGKIKFNGTGWELA